MTSLRFLFALLFCSTSLLAWTDAKMTREERLERRRQRLEERQQRLEARNGKKKRSQCPVNAPSSGDTCERPRRLKPCGYDYRNVPTKVGDSCDGGLDCQPTLTCSCIKGTWACKTKPEEECAGGIKPEGTMDSCPGPLPDVANVFTRDGPTATDEPADEPSDEPVDEAAAEETVDEPADEPCPTEMPWTGDACKRSPNADTCYFDFRGIPDANDAGECLGSISCISLSDCNCDGNGRWICVSATYRRCKGERPEGEGQLCTP